MLVEFSPWETTDTSLRLSVPKQRKRPRGGLSSSSIVCDAEEHFPICGSIVTTKTTRSRKQRKQQCPDSSRSVLALTAPYRVSVLVSQGSTTTATGAPKTEALDAAAYDSLQESSKLQYTCRPGKKASFLPGTTTKSSSRKSSSKAAKKIPVVFDSKNDRFWGLQDGNKRLVVWDAQSEGPEQAAYYEMERPVVSLHVLPSGMVVGSTADLGCIYYASVDNKSNSKDIEVHFLSVPDDLEEQDKATKEWSHAGTFLSLGGETATTASTSTASSTPLVGTKRKASRGSEYGSFELYQVFVHGSTANILLHELVPSSVDPTVDHLERRKHRVASLSLAPPREEPSSVVVQEATLISTTIGNPETALLHYRFAGSPQYYCCTIQLQFATLTNPPYKVDCGAQRIALVTPKILALGMHDKIRLCDANSGIVLKDEPLPFPSEEDNDFVLMSDPRRGFLVALFRQGELLNASTCTLRLEQDGDNANASSSVDPCSFQPSLADRLSAFLSATQTAPKVSKRKPMKRITLLVEPDREEIKTVDMELGEAIQVMEQEEEALTTSTESKYAKGRLVKSFQRSVDCLLKSPIVLRNCPLVDLFPSSSSSSSSSSAAVDDAKRKAKGSSTKDAESNDEVMNGNHHAPSNTNTTTPEFHDASEVTPSDTSVDGDAAANKEKENGKSDTPKSKVSSNGSSGDALEKFPLEFVDAVTPIVVRILRYATSKMSNNERTSQMIKEDCCQVLHSLLASGNVSVRNHIDNDQEGFASLLLAMRCKQTKNKRSRSPIDFILDLLQYCTDVSEAHMVAMMHFMLCRASPDDIAFAFLDFKSLDSEHPYKALASRYLKQLGSKTKDSAKTLEHNKSKLTIAGSSAILERILKYSSCNQALLTLALRETFSFGYETRLLCRLLADVAFPRYTRTTVSSDNNKGLLGTAAQWIPALCDAFGSEMRSKLAKQEDMDNLEHLHKSLTMARLQTEHLLKLEEKINESSLRISEEEETDTEKEGDGSDEQRRKQKKKRTRREEDALPFYSVERLSL